MIVYVNDIKNSQPSDTMRFVKLKIDETQLVRGFHNKSITLLYTFAKDPDTSKLRMIQSLIRHPGEFTNITKSDIERAAWHFCEDIEATIPVSNQ